MYDAQTNSRWSQLFGKAVGGEMEGRSLEKVPSTMTTWGNWKELHPTTTVYIKPSTPYRARFTAATFADIASAEEGPVQPNDLVVGVEGHVNARAYLVRSLAKERVLNEQLEGMPVVVFLSEDLATSRILDRKAGDQVLTMTLAGGDLLRDTETGTTWNPLTGEAVEGPLEGQALREHVSTYSLWFAWKKYRPDTVLVGGP
jgi:hypothetical protein